MSCLEIVLHIFDSLKTLVVSRGFTVEETVLAHGVNVYLNERCCDL